MSKDKRSVKRDSKKKVKAASKRARASNDTGALLYIAMGAVVAAAVVLAIVKYRPQWLPVSQRIAARQRVPQRIPSRPTSIPRIAPLAPAIERSYQSFTPAMQHQLQSGGNGITGENMLRGTL